MEEFDTSRLDAHTLKVFLTVCETGSVSKTAAAFDLNQSTISYTLDRMRAALGDPLFVKSGRGITPTEKSRSILPQVQEIVAGIEGLVGANDYDPTKETRPIVVGLPTPALMPEMKATQAAIRRVAPNLLFQVIRFAPRDRLLEMLELEEADVLIAINMRSYPAVLNSAPYGEDRIVVFYDSNMRGPIQCVSEYTSASHAVADFGGRSKSVVSAELEKRGIKRKICFKSPTTSTLRDFLVGTDMIATMPKGLARSAFSDLAFCEPPMPMPAIRYELVWHKRYDSSGRNTWIRSLLLENSLKPIA